MEYVPGTDLKSLLKQRGRFGLQDTISLMVQACAGVGYAHRAGLVHCDIKPQNMLITPDLRLKVVDFGIARALASIHPEEKVEIVWGSPQYFSPEQAAGIGPSPASDVYSLGVIMYEMLTGELPFTAPTATELARLHRETPPRSPRQINPEIPSVLDEILLKVLAKEPAARYRTADQFGRVLTTLLDSKNDVRGTPVINQAEIPPPVPQPLLANVSPPTSTVSQPRNSTTNQVNPLDVDWLTISLALLALVAVGGLLPFFLWVYFVFNPPIR
jgi:serine/threonine-protein kinase